MDWRPNRLLLAIQPEEGIFLRFEVKQPGPVLRLSPVMMQFYYREAFKTRAPEGYETLLLDIMEGDTTLFLRADQTEAAWSVIMPVGGRLIWLVDREAASLLGAQRYSEDFLS